MSQGDMRRIKVLYVVIVVLLVVIGFLGYRIYKETGALDTFFLGKGNMNQEDVVGYTQPVTRKSNYTLQSRGRSQQHWDPYAEMERMQEYINQVFKVSLNRLHEHEFEDDFQRFNFNLNAEVSEDSRYFVLNISVPNVKADSIEVSVTEKQLQLRGVNEESVEEKDAKGDIIQSELKSTAFFRSINFPEKVDPSSLEKTIEKGVLHIKIKKLNAKT